jgi:serine beta-lactamase-like protein LACTB, mitochondrial
VLWLILALAGCVSADAPADPSPTPTPVPVPVISIELDERPDVAAALDAAALAEDAVGVVVGVARGDTIVFLHGYGFEDREEGIPVDPSRSRFRWASLSKGVTGVVALQASLDGALDLGAEVADVIEGYSVPLTYLPDGCESTDCAVALEADQRSMTVSQLLHHTSGVQHYNNGAVWPSPPITTADDPEVNTGIEWALDYWVDAPLVAVPGTEYSYSTFGFNLAGVAVEHAVGGTFDEIVSAGVASPLGMETFGIDRVWEYVPDRAVGYTRVEGITRPDGDNDVSWKAPGGGFLSSGADLTRYCAGLQSGLLVPDAERDGVLWAGDEVTSSYGLGFGLADNLISHTGSQQKSKTAVAWRPDDGLCFVLMTNSTWVSPFPMLSVVMEEW